MRRPTRRWQGSRAIGRPSPGKHSLVRVSEQRIRTLEHGPEDRAARGSAKLEVEHRGAKFYFSTHENQELFRKSPEQYGLRGGGERSSDRFWPSQRFTSNPGTIGRSLSWPRPLACRATIFASRFRDLVGDTPMRYLARWRMLAARTLLEEGRVSTAEVADRVGYRSEFAFAKAFKRAFGKGPGQYRRPA